MRTKILTDTTCDLSRERRAALDITALPLHVMLGGVDHLDGVDVTQEQLGGANGELKAAMQYMSQSFRIKDQEIKDLFLDIAAEELGHMEMVAQTINLLNGHGR